MVLSFISSDTSIFIELFPSSLDREIEIEEDSLLE